MWLAAAGAALANGDPATESPPALTAAQRDLQRVSACTRLATAAFPVSDAERQSALARLESARESCKDQPPFLALLGGLWLEHGDPSRALLWLERSLMLDPNQPAAQADHALALAALGDFTARDELMARWRDRTDVPALVWARLRNTAPPVTRAEAASRWMRFREISILYGYESNLDHSPKLTELTITPPDGPITLPLTEPVQPRPGSAGTIDASWQVAYSPAGGTVLQAGLQGSARAAPSNSATDWHNLQLAMSASQRWGSWRTQLHAGLSGFGGSLNEPYRLARLGLSLESNGLGCTYRWALDHETRQQSSTSLHDSASLGGVLNLKCPAPGLGDWTFGLAVRAVVDRPNDPERPGGVQRQASLGVRASGPLSAGWTADFSVRVTRSRDDVGYSDLLENDARRWMNLTQAQVELLRSLDRDLFRRADAVVQLQHVRQRSNLPVFEFSSTGLFGGLRWRW